MLRILLVDDHKLFRELLIPALEEIDSQVLIYEASSIYEAKNLLKHYNEIDLIILDLVYPDHHSWDTFPFTNHKVKNIPIIVLTASDQAQDVKYAMNKGCKGYITKSSSKQQLLIGLKTVISDNIYISPDMVTLLETERYIPKSKKQLSSYPELSNRQLQILKLLAKGHSNKNIAARCQISEGTVKLHVSTILKLLGVSNRTQAVIKVNELNLL